ncbi:DUF239 domain-containing protein [Silvanigrella paludirubra]|uniref:DUF239 domain-containing protein n=1 Tax=Silvanigrella paludirubra TaxID=2499159 RepID=A0A6N6VUL6_9BACT|nr:neprosin family prolyl endopeptidase [Silvanigrella paludirubra]KAB8037881.1 DUF239 domain-containing protein [Silvanigrella paludirubra]
MIKKMTRNTLLISSLFLYNIANAENNSLQNKNIVIQDSFNVTNYINTISQYQPKVVELSERIQKTVDYYQKVHILKTFQNKEYIVDCVPFTEQPSLIDKPELAIKLLKEFEKKNHQKSLKEIGSNFDFNTATECPNESVGIIRPSQTSLASKFILKKSLNDSLLYGENEASDSVSGYTWQVGVTPTNKIIYLNKDHGEAHFKGPQLQSVTSSNQDDHSLDQFWLLYTGKNKERFSVEFGIMASGYFTTHPSTSIFVYASIDNYGAKSCYNLGCPGFVQFPRTPVVGVPITDKNADYIFKVHHKKENDFKTGYYLTLEIFDPLNNVFHKESVILGYYPDSIYPLDNLPNTFSAGAEIYADAPANGTILYGNYLNPLEGYYRKKQIGIFTQNKNNFPSYIDKKIFPFLTVWKFGQKE